MPSIDVGICVVEFDSVDEMRSAFRNVLAQVEEHEQFCSVLTVTSPDGRYLMIVGSPDLDALAMATDFAEAQGGRSVWEDLDPLMLEAAASRIALAHLTGRNEVVDWTEEP